MLGSQDLNARPKCWYVLLPRVIDTEPAQLLVALTEHYLLLKSRGLL